jgi:predicted O-methyltransferase YrrM
MKLKPAQPLVPSDPRFAPTTMPLGEERFYLPALAGPGTFLRDVCGASAVDGAMGTLEKLEPDAYSEYILDYYRTGLDRFGESWWYADISTVLYGLSKRLGFRDYLEIGVRRGRSMAMVAAASPNVSCVGFDLWVQDYAGMPNPGEQLVRSELAKIGHRGQLELIAGDSARTVPQYFAQHPERYFDAITVDGDHSLKGARKDLKNVIPRLRIGGALVFDDVATQYHPELEALWDEITADSRRFASWKFTECGFGIAFAFRKQ